MSIGAYTAKTAVGKSHERRLRHYLHQKSGDLPLSFALKEVVDRLSKSISANRKTLARVSSRDDMRLGKIGGTRPKFPHSDATRKRDAAQVKKRLLTFIPEHKRFKNALDHARGRERAERPLRKMVAQQIASTITREVSAELPANTDPEFIGAFVKGDYPEQKIVLRFKTWEILESSAPNADVVDREMTHWAGGGPQPDFVKTVTSEPRVLFIDWEKSIFSDTAKAIREQSVWSKIIELVVLEVITSILLGPVLKGIMLAIRGLVLVGRAAVRIKGVSRFVSSAHKIATKTANKAKRLWRPKGNQRKLPAPKNSKGGAKSGKTSAGNKGQKRRRKAKENDKTTEKRSTDRESTTKRPTKSDRKTDRAPYAERKTSQRYPEPKPEEAREFGKKVEEIFKNDPDFSTLNRAGKKEFPVFDALRGTAHEGDLVSEIASKSHTTLWGKFKKMFRGLDHPKDKGKFAKAVERLKKERLIGPNVKNPAANVVDRAVLGVHPVGGMNAKSFRNWLRKKLTASKGDYSKLSKGIEMYAARLRKAGWSEEKIINAIVDKVKAMSRVQ